MRGRQDELEFETTELRTKLEDAEDRVAKAEASLQGALAEEGLRRKPVRDALLESVR